VQHLEDRADCGTDFDLVGSYGFAAQQIQDLI